MRFRFRLPFGGSTAEAIPNNSLSVVDGRDVVIPNRWKLPPHSVAVIGRPAVYFALDLATPRIPLGSATISSRQVHWEADLGGHLFVAVTGVDASSVTVLEAGPTGRNGTGALVPFGYPEDTIADRGAPDFSPVIVEPPNGLTVAAFADLVLSTQRSYDGDQRYVAIELSFFFVGRDSNSYAAAVLLCCGVDLRAVPKPHDVARYEWTGYPGLSDPVHLSSFGMYLGAPTPLAGGAMDVAYHNEDGSVRFVVVGGEPNGRARLPDGAEVTLDGLGRILFAPEDAARHHLPSARTAPPTQFENRRRYPKDPAPAGGLVTLVVNGRSVPLEPGMEYRGSIVHRHDALGLATLRCQTGDVIMPIWELGVELRDPKRVQSLFREGNELTVGLHRNRHPKLVVHGSQLFGDRFRLRRIHAPRRIEIFATLCGLAMLTAAVLILRRRAT